MANENIALDLDLFDVQKNVYVPEDVPAKKIKKPTLLDVKPVSRKQEAREAHEARSLAVKACVFALTMFLTIGAIIFCHVELTNRQVELARLQSELNLLENEYITLNMKYDSIMSKDKIAEYAETHLGMVKRESYHISYFDISDESGAVLTK